MGLRWPTSVRISAETKVVFMLLAVVLIVAGALYSSACETVTLDLGKGVRVVKTRVGTVGELLKEEGVSLRTCDKVFPSSKVKISDGMTIKVKRAVPVIVRLGKKKKTIMTCASTVLNALRDGGYAVDADDKVAPARGKRITPGIKITLIPVVKKLQTAHVKIPFSTRVEDDPEADKGTESVATEGSEGELLKIARVTYEGGVKVKEEPAGERVLKAPVEQVVRRGTKVKVAQVFRDSPLSSRGAARTEIPESASAPAGREMAVDATGYAPYNGPGVGGTTATGARAGYGMVAVDPSVIPLGTRLYIEGYGYGTAADTGGAILGDRIDLCFDSVSEAIAWGRRRVTIKILD